MAKLLRRGLIAPVDGQVPAEVAAAVAVLDAEDQSTSCSPAAATDWVALVDAIPSAERPPGRGGDQMRVGVERVEVGAVEAGGDVRTAIAEQAAQIDDGCEFWLDAQRLGDRIVAAQSGTGSPTTTPSRSRCSTAHRR